MQCDVCLELTWEGHNVAEHERVAYEKGTAVAFGLMCMAEAIRVRGVRRLDTSPDVSDPRLWRRPSCECRAGAGVSPYCPIHGVRP